LARRTIAKTEFTIIASQKTASSKPRVAVIGGGPAGLMAAEILSAGGVGVTVYDRMPSVGRKLLIAGRGGLNLTHSEPLAQFVTRYGAASAWLEPILHAFPPKALIAWAEGLGEPTFVGSSGRVFPKAMKASPLLRAWLKRLVAQGVGFKTRHDWRGWDASGNLIFVRQEGEIERVRPDATLLALGGASWPKLGSNGAWAEFLRARGVKLNPFLPSNCGFKVAWSEAFATRFEGTPLKNIALSFGVRTVRGEALITRGGVEGGAVYALSADIRDALAARGNASIEIDLCPALGAAQVAEKLDRQRGDQSVSNLLRKAVNLPPVAINLMREAHGAALNANSATLAQQVKSVRINLTGTQPLERAISTAGGVALDAVDQTLMLKAAPGVYVSGEMLDWEAPTGGYLLQAAFSSAVVAARALLVRLTDAK
jgi:uncharacterized flavoprotein (TIGR03862 family)